MHKYQKGFTLIELLLALLLTAMLSIVIFSLFFQLIKTERRLVYFNRMNNSANHLFTDMAQDIRFGDNVRLENFNAAEGYFEKLIIEDLDDANVVIGIITYEKSGNQILVTKNGTTSTLLSDNILAEKFGFENRADPDHLPLIYTVLALTSPPNQKQIIKVDRQSMVSNLNKNLKIESGNPWVTITPMATPTATRTPTPTATPALPTPTGSVIPTRTPTPSRTATSTPTLALSPSATSTPTPPPGCELPSQPSGWTSQAIGTTHQGITHVDGSRMHLCGSGDKIEDNKDEFQYAFRSGSSFELEMTTRVAEWYPHKPWSRAGLMFRSSTAADASNVSLFVTGGQELRMQWRRNNGSDTTITGSRGSNNIPVWLKLIKINNVVTGYYSYNSTNGTNGTWTVIRTIDINIGFNHLYGRAVSSAEDGQFASAVFDNTVIQNNASMTPAPTATPRPSNTPTPTSQFSPTPTPTKKPTATPTKSTNPSPTATRTPTPTRVNTPTPTTTRIPTRTPTPTTFISD